MRRFGFALVTFLLALVALPAAAQPAGQNNLTVDLIAESDAPAAGSEVTIAFVAKPDPGWHGYWKNPGDAGLDTRLDWTLPQGVTAGKLRYPVPTRLMIAGIMNYIYKGNYTQFATLKIPAGLAPGTQLPIAVRAAYLICTDEICVPETENLTINLTVGDGSITPERRAQFDQWRRLLPKPLGSEATFQVTDGTLRIAIPFPASVDLWKDAYFFAQTPDAVTYSAPQSVTRDGDTLILSVKAGSKVPERLEGVLATSERDGFSLTAVPGTVAAAPAAPAAIDWSAALLALGGALLGGLILNIMPCVFPILSLKALSLAKSGTSEAHARAEGLAYTAGVVIVVLALGGLMLGLRAAGASVGWAFQLTDPRVILLLLLLVLGIALNLAGLFELATPKFAGRLSSGGSGGAFMTGALAAFIATPCTGPFMGAALGAALVLPWYIALIIFLGLGLGLALPFLLLGFVPALRRMLPKPGAWMDSFRKILSVPMFLTAIALAWVLGGLTGVNGMATGLIVALALGVVLWALGRRQARGAGNGIAWAMSLAILIGGMWLVGRIEKPAAAAVAASGAQPFSEAKLAELRAQNKPVFAYFTADWCVTCKVNEKAAIETDAVRDAFAKGGVTVLVGDWTDGDPALGRFIERHNRAGVPLYLWYPAGASEPQVLPQLLTQGMLTDLTGGK